MQSLNRVKLRDGNWLDTTAVLRKKILDSEVSPSAEQFAILYSRSVLPDAAKGQDLDVGFADFLDAPDLEAIDFSQFTGKKGSRILVLLGNAMEGATLEIRIMAWDGSLAFQGFAEPGLFPTEWTFTLPTESLPPWSRILLRYFRS